MPRATPPDEASAAARVHALFATPVGRVLKATLFGAFALLALSLVVRQARAAVHRISTYRIDATDVAFIDLPSFVDDQMKSGLKAGLSDLWPEEPGRLPSLYDAGLDRRLRELLAAHPMIREIEDVDVRYPSEVRVRATIRAPLARFHARVGADRTAQPIFVDVPLDQEAIVLDAVNYGPMLAKRHMVIVTGVGSICPGVGHRWSDRLEQVAEGLEAARVANRLNEELSIPGAPRVEGVDVSAFPAAPKDRGRGEVVLKLSDGRKVQWGRTERDLSGVVREDSYDAKRNRLVDQLEARGTTDHRDLDVRFPPSARAGS